MLLETVSRAIDAVAFQGTAGRISVHQFPSMLDKAGAYSGYVVQNPDLEGPSRAYLVMSADTGVRLDQLSCTIKTVRELPPQFHDT